jgi:rhodanese-related sulfurtransferase
MHHAPVRPTGSARPARAALGAALLAVLALTVLAACGGDDAASGSGADTGPAPGEASAAVALEENATAIDVRTPEEYAAGHVEGAELIDVQSPDFDDRIAALDPSGSYVVYCRSGNRSAQAADRMEAVGLTVVDGGSLGDMVAAGWPEASG